MGEDPNMEHVRVGQHDVGVLADPRPLLAGGVTVVGGFDHFGASQPVDGAQLILSQRLGRVEEQGRGRFLGQQRLHDRNLIAQRFARGGAGHHHRVLAGAH